MLGTSLENFGNFFGTFSELLINFLQAAFKLLTNIQSDQKIEKKLTQFLEIWPKL
jgi:hypothetical protein